MSEPQYKNMRDLLSDAVSVLEPPERLTVSQAAAKYRFLNNPGSYVGRWKNDAVPYLVEPMDVLRSKEYSSCIFVGAAQTGKTDALLVNPLLHAVICDPVDMIIYQTSQSVARDFSKRRIDRLHLHSPEVGRSLRSGAKYDNTHDKHYINGMMLSLSWPTINELSGRPVALCALTDYDRMPLDIDGNGSPFDLARKRTTTFGESAMTLAESSPGYPVSDTSHMPSTLHEAPPSPGILSLYNRGDRRRWYWPCGHCEEYYQPEFRLLKWVNSKDEMECAESAEMLCPHCGSLNSHDLKHELNNAGAYVKDGQTISKGGVIHGRGVASDIASFWPKGVTASFSTWKTLVLNYLKAQKEFEQTGDQSSLKTTVNTDQGEPYIERGGGEIRLPEELRSRAENFGGDEPCVPDLVRYLVATIDVQKNAYIVQVHGVIPPPREGTLFDSVVIDRYEIVKSDRFDIDGDRMWVSPGTYLEDWMLITDRVIKSSYPLGDGSGRRMAIKVTGCDSGGRDGVTSMAYLYWLSLKSRGLAGKLILVKGNPRQSSPRVEVTYPDNQLKGMKPSQTGQVPVLMINSNKVKDHLNNVLDRVVAGGMVRFSDLLNDEFFTELTVETRGSDGKWTNKKKLRNESFDLLCYFYALCFHLRVEFTNWDSPPSWADVWDNNSLVFDGRDRNRLEPVKKSDFKSIEGLGALLGG